MPEALKPKALDAENPQNLPPDPSSKNPKDAALIPASSTLKPATPSSLPKSFN